MLRKIYITTIIVLACLAILYLFYDNYGVVKVTVNVKDAAVLSDTKQSSEMIKKVSSHTTEQTIKETYLTSDIAKNYESSEFVNDKANMSLILTFVGVNLQDFKYAVDKLPYNITVTVPSNVSCRDNAISYARAMHKEVLLDIPMEPLDFPDHDPGINTLLTGITNDENQKKLEALVNGVEGIVGVINTTGTRFIVSYPEVDFLIKYLDKRKLFFINAASYDFEASKNLFSNTKVLFANVEDMVDADFANKDKILEELDKLRNEFQTDKLFKVIKIFPATKLVVDTIIEWLSINSKSVNFVSVSSLILSNADDKEEYQPLLESSSTEVSTNASNKSELVSMEPKKDIDNKKDIKTNASDKQNVSYKITKITQS